MFEHGMVGLTHWGTWFLGAALIGAGSIGTLMFLRLRKKPIKNTDRIDSLEILKARLARGDISVEEFNTLKTSLG